MNKEKTNMNKENKQKEINKPVPFVRV